MTFSPGRAPRRRTSKQQQRLRAYVTLLALDVVSIIIGFLFADLLRFGNPLSGPGPDLIAVILPIFIPLAFSSQSYSLTVLKKPTYGIFQAVKAFAFSAAAVLGILFYMKAATDVSRIVFGAGTLFSIGSIAATRYFFGHWVGARFRWNFVNEVVLVDGIPMLPLAGQILMFADQLGLTPSSNDPQTFDRIGRLLANCDRVVLAAPPDRRTGWTRALKGSGVDVEVLTPELDQLGALGLSQFNGRSAVVIASGPLGIRARILKRTLDLLIVVPALMVLGPVMAAIAIAIRLETSGPILFRQQRVGKGNRIFEVLKFRSMRVEATDSGGTRSASRDDDRITKVGRFIRATSLDELPQLFNVLKGDMSVVGPRPHALASTADSSLFWTIDTRYWERGAVKPGMTGLAQVRGYRGATHTRQDLINRVQADLEYLNGWTIWRDIAIIARTAKVLVHPNAY